MNTKKCVICGKAQAEGVLIDICVSCAEKRRSEMAARLAAAQEDYPGQPSEVIPRPIYTGAVPGNRNAGFAGDAEELRQISADVEIRRRRR